MAGDLFFDCDEIPRSLHELPQEVDGRIAQTEKMRLANMVAGTFLVSNPTGAGLRFQVVSPRVGVSADSLWVTG